MAERTLLVGNYRVENLEALQQRQKKLSADPRAPFYNAMFKYSDYEHYLNAVGALAVDVKGYKDNPITGRDEILYARRRGWIRDADHQEKKSSSDGSRAAFRAMTAQAIVQAIAEFDELTRDRFLNTYGYGKAREYFLNVGGKHYDSKAIVGVAAKYLPEIARPLRNDDFSGGEKRVERLLERLGFTVDRVPNGVPAANPFERGKVYNRQKEIHRHFGGQERGGIATPDRPFVFLFTGEHGMTFGYQDGERADGIFEFTGEGQTGDMSFIKGNKAIRDHVENGKDLLLFRALKQKGQYRFLGTYVCDGFQWRMAPDKSGSLRKVIVFDLMPLENLDDATTERNAQSNEKLSLDELRQRAYTAAKDSGGTAGSGRRTIYARSRDVRDYVLGRAKGICEACEKPAPFNRTDGTPYLEPHHTRRLSDGGPDHPRWVAAICPTCHRLIHHGAEGRWVNANLQDRLGKIEGEGSASGGAS